MLSVGLLSQTVVQVVAQFKAILPLLLRWFSILVGIHLLNTLLGGRLCVLGIVPRTWHGLVGVLWAPWLHINFEHLISNCIILFALSSMVALSGQAVLVWVLMCGLLLGGFLTWCFGRSAVHVGASGVVMACWGFLLCTAYHSPGLISVSVACVGLYYFGGLVLHVLPMGRHDSWEGHLFGFLAGVFAGQWPVVALPPPIQDFIFSISS